MVVFLTFVSQDSKLTIQRKAEVGLTDKKQTVVPWKKTGERTQKVGYRSVLVRTYEMPDGRSVDFDLLDIGGVAVVLPLTSGNNVVLAKQFRPGPEEIILELPGGVCEPGETPIVSAARELAEETGFTGYLQHVNTSFISGYAVGIRHCFVATDCHRTHPQKLDKNEFIEVVEMPLARFMMHLRSGQLSDVAAGYLCLDFLGLL